MKDGPPVLVVGAGPVGLVAALGFAAHGIDVCVLESGPPDVAAEWRGSTLHPPTVEILDRLGLAEAPLRHGIQVSRVQHRDLELDLVVEFDLAVLADRTRFPFRLQYEQYKLLRELRDAAERHRRVDVRYHHRVTGVVAGDETTSAEVIVEPAGGPVARWRTPWVVVADGSHSTVRRSLGIAMPGDTYPTASLVVATGFAFDAAIPGLAPVSYWSGPRGRVSLIRTPDTWRVALTTDDLPTGSGEVDGDGSLHPRFLETMSLLVGRRDFTDVRQHQLYRSHQRVADAFHVGRVVLIGDAAHLSATIGGMGLNSGVHDAYELVEVLAPALRAGETGHAAVGGVADARRQVALQVVQPTTRATRAQVDATGLDERRRRLTELGELATDPRRLRQHLATASMLDAVTLRMRSDGVEPAVRKAAAR